MELTRRNSCRSSPARSLTWNVAPEDYPHIPQHWFAFPAPDDFDNYLLGFLYFIFFVVSCLGNGLVIWIFSSAKNLRTPSNMFVVNLAIFDFIMMAKTPIMIYNSMHSGFAAGHTWCQVFAAMGTISGIGASATNACIAYDRYATIANPLERKMGKTRATIMCLLVWAYAVPWAVLPLTETWGRFVPEGYLTTCTFDYLSDDIVNKYFVATLFVFSYVLPVSLIIYFYSRIVGHVVAHERTLREQAKKMNVESLRSNSRQKNEAAEIRIAKAAVTICSLFVASWTPYAVVALIGSFGNKNLITPGVSMIPACACKAVACIDPYVYAIAHPRYRTELQKRIPSLSGCLKENDEGGDASSQVTGNTENCTSNPQSN
ncbi:UNVERIFIED_CONTAM: hypothetical protein PYX00_007847 [Menopon gallinae]|uniref:G-protein coupled receptors family 1 profile domain-containing protein n=1 Tax=Menopon gallinae TaxID=328185 RepID=A0AAW2HKZ9_9NEOP